MTNACSEPVDQPQPTAGRPGFVAGTVEPGVVPRLAGSVVAVAVEVALGCVPGAATPTKSRPSTTTTSALLRAGRSGTSGADAAEVRGDDLGLAERAGRVADLGRGVVGAVGVAGRRTAS